ncbi:hypothetical protein IKE83_02665 [Candidatus Saccharibacteria bacterium]|nr:hypothetical protein [Candidatus Saccharibacteria bacterium]
MSRKGDTLIEVAFAIGIFSLVAVSVVSVVNSSTSSAQAALETTLTREEIDAQAEALRFIHTSYVAGGLANSVNNQDYTALWRTLTSFADHKDETLQEILSYNPSTCAELYEKGSQNTNIYTQDAFIINPRRLGDGASAIIGAKDLYEMDNQTEFFSASSTFPRLRFGSGDNLFDQDKLGVNDLNSAEGLFIVAVRDSGTTNIVGSSDNTSAYYDFYIRSCWFTAGAERPSTISTVIRLNDPEYVYQRSIKITYKMNGADDVVQETFAGTPIRLLPSNTFEAPEGYTFSAWCSGDPPDEVGKGCPNFSYQPSTRHPFSENTTLYPSWKEEVSASEPES